jgi:hypothetical protein
MHEEKKKKEEERRGDNPALLQPTAPFTYLECSV